MRNANFWKEKNAFFKNFKQYDSNIIQNCHIFAVTGRFKFEEKQYLVNLTKTIHYRFFKWAGHENKTWKLFQRYVSQVRTLCRTPMLGERTVPIPFTSKLIWFLHLNHFAVCLNLIQSMGRRAACLSSKICASTYDPRRCPHKNTTTWATSAIKAKPITTTWVCFNKTYCTSAPIWSC